MVTFKGCSKTVKNYLLLCADGFVVLIVNNFFYFEKIKCMYNNGLGNAHPAP
jgi:hypothetical protein